MNLRETPSTVSPYRAYVRKVAGGKISAFLGTIDDDGEYKSRVYAGSASMGESIAADYHGRFLIELIQNANDVHPDEGGNGEIEVVFHKSDSGEATLYVANRGTPFARKNVDALCEMGLSSKPPGESIGNKGLGFRSVHHITDAPHIYSQSESEPDPSWFNGFCFRFADHADLAALIDHPRHLELARQDLPLFHVPSWLDDQPDDVVAFARRGFSTVIALPLRSPNAAAEVEAEIASVQSQTVPMLLFLARLKRLSIWTVGEDGERTLALELTRAERPIQTGTAPLALVDMASAGRYLVARCRISEAAMKAAVSEGVDRKQLHKHWLGWTGEGDVALAVRLDRCIQTPRLFTFLPMGEQAAAPFPGHLHASFFPSANRKGLDATVRLNALLLAEAADLAARTVRQLVVAEGDLAANLDTASRARAVADLLSWRHIASLQAVNDLPKRVATGVADAMGAADFALAAVIPVLQIGDAQTSISWRTPAEVRHWPHQQRTFNAEVAAEHAGTTGVWPLWPGLEDRLDLLVAYLTDQVPNHPQTPTAEERVELAVRVAEDLGASRRFAPSRWSAYYLDLAQLLDKSGAALAGRRILLCSDGRLHLAMTSAAEPEGATRRRRRGAVVASVFAPPARRGSGSDEEAQLKPPASLADNFAFLSSQLDWHGELSEAREFLEKAKLVFEFDREGILAQLSRMMRSDGRSTTRAAGLRWAFQIWRQPYDKGRPIKLQPQHRFFVPTLDGEFIEARDAVFSDTWPEDTHGRLVQRFLSSAPIDSDDLVQLSKTRLADKSHYAFKGSRPDLWTVFLTELGVRRGLHPVKKDLDSAKGWKLRDMSFCGPLGISPQAAEAWKAAILARSASAMSLSPNSDYLLRGDIWWLPGQGDLDRFNRECLEHYARLIIIWFGQSHSISWEIDVHHHQFIYADARYWPTPLSAFLRSAAWIPADEPSTSGQRKLTVRASEIWLAADGAERFPSFLRRPSLPVMRALEQATNTQLEALRTHANLRTFNTPDTLLDQARFLTGQYARDDFEPYFERHWFNLYHQAWRQIAARFAGGQIDPADQKPPSQIIARKAGEPMRLDLVSDTDDGANEVLYVRDTVDETAASLIEASGRPFFDVRMQDPAPVGPMMRRLYGERVRLSSEAHYVMKVDGQPVGAGDVAPALARCPRLRLMVAVALEALRGGEFQRLPTDRSAVIVRLEHLLFQRANKISFAIDGLEVDQDIGRKSAFSLKTDDAQTIIVVSAAGPVDWAVIDQALAAICEAIEQPGLEANLRNLLLSAQAWGLAAQEASALEKELERMCDVLHLNGAARSAVRDTLGARLERYAPWLKAVLHLASGPEAVDAFAGQEAAVVQDVVQLREALSPWLGPLGLEPARVIEACRSALSVGELRDILGLDFAGLNTALQAVGEEPDTFPDLHRSLIAAFVHTHDLAIIDALRVAHSKTLAAGVAAPRYAQAREEVRSLAPDPDWLVRYIEVPDDILQTHLGAWLAREGAPALAAPKPNLEPLEDVRRLNALELKRFTASAGPLVRAWCRGKGVSVWTGWNEADGGLVALRGLFDEAGIFEFRILNEADVIDWAATVGVWPAGMDRTLDRTRLGIVEDDLNAERLKAQAAIEARRKEERSISFKGRPIDPEEVDWQALATELGESLSSAMLKTSLGGQARLLPALEKAGRASRPSNRSGSGGSGGFAPSSKTDMIGRLGEIAVYYWLKHRLKQDIDAAWRSKNATPFTGREGSDSLGYDFEVTFRNQPWQIEVKASLGDPRTFEMGETEVRAGRAAARGRGVQYWIAYVSNLSQPGQARVELLPNPMSEDGEAVLNLLGEGLRYGFRRP